MSLRNQTIKAIIKAAPWATLPARITPLQLLWVFVTLWIRLRLVSSHPSLFMINGTANQTAQIVYKKITVTSLVMFFSLASKKHPSALLIVKAFRSQFQLPKCLHSIFTSWLPDCAWFYVWSGGEDLLQECATSKTHENCSQGFEWQLSLTVSRLSLSIAPALPHFLPLQWFNSLVASWTGFKHWTLNSHGYGMHWQHTHTCTHMQSYKALAWMCKGRLSFFVCVLNLM